MEIILLFTTTIAITAVYYTNLLSIEQTNIKNKLYFIFYDIHARTQVTLVFQINHYINILKDVVEA